MIRSREPVKKMKQKGKRFTTNFSRHTSAMRSASVSSGGGSVVPSVKSIDVGSNSRTFS